MSKARTGKEYAKSRVGERGERDMPNEYEFDAIAGSFDAGRSSRDEALNACRVLIAKLLNCRDDEKFGCGITCGEVWTAANAILIDEGERPLHPNEKHPSLPSTQLLPIPHNGPAD
jgi:hypothetical protein